MDLIDFDFDLCRSFLDVLDCVEYFSAMTIYAYVGEDLGYASLFVNYEGDSFVGYACGA